VFADGTALETDVVVFSAGIRPRDELARAAGLAVGERGGIQDRFALPHEQPRYLRRRRVRAVAWQDLRPRFRRATRWPRSPPATIAGEDVQFLGADMSTKLKLMGVDVASIGDAQGATPDALNYVFADEAAGVYKNWW